MCKVQLSEYVTYFPLPFPCSIKPLTKYPGQSFLVVYGISETQSPVLTEKGPTSQSILERYLKNAGTQAVRFTEVQQSEDQLKNKYKQEMKTYPKKKTPTLTKHNIKMQRHMRF